MTSLPISMSELNWLLIISASSVAYLLILFFLKYHWVQHRNAIDNVSSPPNPHWFLGHFPLLWGELQNFLDCISTTFADKYGRTSLWMFCFGKKAIVVTDYNDARYLLSVSSYRKTASFVEIHLERFLGKYNIGFLNGTEWKFHHAAIVRSFNPVTLGKDNIHASIMSVVNVFLESLKKQGGSAHMEIEHAMKMITIDVFGKSAFDKDFGSCRDFQPSRLANAFEYMNSEFNRRIVPSVSLSTIVGAVYWFPTEANRKYEEERSYLRGVLEGIVEEHKENAKTKKTPESVANKTLLSRLLETHNELQTKGDSNELSNETITDVLVSILFAGYDTASITLTYALYHVAKCPEIEKLVLEEVNREGIDDMEKLQYCKAVVMETLRLFPPALMISRTMTKDVELRGGVIVPKDSLAYIPFWSIQRKEAHFPNALEFRPDRWACRAESGAWKERSDEPGDIAPANRKAFLAFSAGGRSCAGYKFAMQEAVTVFAALVKNIKFSVAPDYEPKPMRVGLMQAPEGGMPMTMKLR